jgi:hypothetical protein
MIPRARLKLFSIAGSATLAILIALIAVRSWAQLPAGAISPAQVQQIVAGIQVLRGLKFKSRVPISYLTPDQAAARVRAEVDRENRNDVLVLEAKAGAMLGLYPPGFEVKDVTLAMLKRELGGFYDPRKKDLVIIESPLAKGAKITRVQKIETVNVIAHELTHGLQDQNYNIGSILDQAKDDDDRAVAMSAVVEGDATLAGFGFIAGGMDDRVLDVFVKHIPDMEKEFAEKTRDVPLGVREPFIFKYMYGARFVAEAYHRNGWNGVNALFEHPPQSTQQILNPWMYFDRSTPRPEVHLAGYEKVLNGWKRGEVSTFGELLLRVLIQSTLGKDSSYVALSNAWDGDSAVILSNGKSVTVLWMIAFTNDESAETFAVAYGSALDKINGARTAHRIERNASEVLVMVGDGAIRFHEFLPEVWKESTVTAVPMVR